VLRTNPGLSDGIPLGYQAYAAAADFDYETYPEIQGTLEKRDLVQREYGGRLELLMEALRKCDKY